MHAQPAGNEEELPPTAQRRFEASVCICTYRRPELLAMTLTGLLRQVPQSPRFEVVVVDNDVTRSAESVVALHPANGRLTVRYLVEPRQNIALARNRAVAAACGDWLALIDDDEYPQANWLRHLMETARATGASAVLGPVLPELPGHAASWIRDGRFFDRPRYATGTVVPYMQVRTGNLLIQRRILAALPGPFDARYGLTGGEDIMLLEQLRRRGHRLVWCDDAVVAETVPDNRLTRAWLLRRGYRGAQAYARVHRSLSPTRSGRALRTLTMIARGGLMLPTALLFTLFWLPLDHARSVRWCQRASMHAGMLSALAGRRSRGYADCG